MNLEDAFCGLGGDTDPDGDDLRRRWMADGQPNLVVGMGTRGRAA